MSRDFAKTVHASCGLQVLFFVEPDADANERAAFKALGGVGVEHADLVVAHVLQMTGMESE